MTEHERIDQKKHREHWRNFWLSSAIVAGLFVPALAYPAILATGAAQANIEGHEHHWGTKLMTIFQGKKKHGGDHGGGHGGGHGGH